MISKNNQKQFDFLTIIFPYKGYHKRIDETKDQIKIDNWEINTTKWEIEGNNPVAMSKMYENFFFGIKEVKLNDLTLQVSATTDIYLKLKDEKLTVQLLGDDATSVRLYQEKGKEITKVLEPGDRFLFKLN